MKVSTAVELVGFACLVAAAVMLNLVAGVAVAGAACLFVGYATEDPVAGLQIRKMVAPFARRHARRVLLRRQRKAARPGRERRLSRRRAAELNINVKGS